MSENEKAGTAVAGTAQAATPAQRQAAGVPIEVGAKGMEFTSIEAVYRFGQFGVQSGIYPNLVHPSQYVVLYQQSKDLKVLFTTLLQYSYFVNNRLGYWGDGFMAIGYANGMADIDETLEGTGDAMIATCKVWRRGREKPFVATFSVEDAKRAHLWPGTEVAGRKEKSTWKEYPQRMLQMRARSWAMRDAGVTAGAQAAEEVDDTPPSNVVETTGRVMKPGETRVDDLTARLAAKPETDAAPPQATPNVASATPEVAPPAAAEKPKSKRKAKHSVCPLCDGELTTSGLTEDQVGCLRCKACSAIIDADGDLVGAAPAGQEAAAEPGKATLAPS